MSERKPIPKKLRFEVFKRDSFTCQYCGRKAPDIILQIDHIEPVSKGGTNDILNLIASCKDCNAGKSDRRLSENAVIDKRRQQLEELQERKEQIEMMFEWQKSLLNLDDEVVDRLADYWSELVPGYSLNENGIRGLRKLKTKFSIEEIMEAMKTAADQYLTYEDGVLAKHSVEMAWGKVGGICNVRRVGEKTPYIQRLYYIRGILRNRLHYVNEELAMQLLQKAVELDANIERLEDHAKTVRNWTEWRASIENFIAEQTQDHKTDGPKTTSG
ncbi:HNH endonuclease [Candidatus Poribacteria bacterium]